MRKLKKACPKEQQVLKRIIKALNPPTSSLPTICQKEEKRTLSQSSHELKYITAASVLKGNTLNSSWVGEGGGGEGMRVGI